jgi:hypothetical protein
MDEVRPTFSHHAQMAQMRQSTSSWRANKRGASPLVPEGPMAVRLKKFAPIGNEPSLCSLLWRIVPKIHPRKRPQRLPPALGPFFVPWLRCAPNQVESLDVPRVARRCGAPHSVEPDHDFAEGTFAVLQRRPVLGGGQLWILEKVLCFGCLACRCRSFCCWHCFGTIEDDEPCSSLRMRVVYLSPHAGRATKFR